MAKSKSGGTRTYIRGRVGSDVYSIGRDAKGKKQQVVRSLAESVANPQTQAQMKGRMIMSTLAQAQSALLPIIDHSFDGVSGRRANLAEFVSRNYALIKADVAANPATGNKFGLVLYQGKGAKQGQYVISDGKALIPAALVLTKSTGVIAITLPSDDITIGGLKSALGMTSEEYFTLVGINANGGAEYERFRVNPTLSDDTAIAAGNIGDVFAVEGNVAATITVATNVITITLSSVADCCAVIVSIKSASGYIHNQAVLGEGTSFPNAADIALPTYPVGAQDYLNGGDIFGQQESFNPGGDVPPTPSPTQSAISSVTVNGASLAQTGSAALNQGANALVIGISQGTDGASYGVAVVAKQGTVVGGTVPAGSQTSVIGSSVNLSETGVLDGADKVIVLCRNNSITQIWGTLTEPVTPPATGDIVSINFAGNPVTESGDTYVSSKSGSCVGVRVQNPSQNGLYFFAAKEAVNVGDSIENMSGDTFVSSSSAETQTFNAGDNSTTDLYFGLCKSSGENYFEVVQTWGHAVVMGD
jgi:hypothetical protein